MNPAYVAFLEALFPMIDPYTAQRASDAIREVIESEGTLSLFGDPLDDDLQQGDIFSWVPFPFVDETGQPAVAEWTGMLLTNSCDAVRNDYLEFAAMPLLDEFSQETERQRMIRSNVNYEYIYFPDPRTRERFVDLGVVSSISRSAFEEFLNRGKTRRIASLNQHGMFLLYTKLTVFYMRPEDLEVGASRMR